MTFSSFNTHTHGIMTHNKNHSAGAGNQSKSPAPNTMSRPPYRADGLHLSQSSPMCQVTDTQHIYREYTEHAVKTTNEQLSALSTSPFPSQRFRYFFPHLPSLSWLLRLPRRATLPQSDTGLINSGIRAVCRLGKSSNPLLSFPREVVYRPGRERRRAKKDRRERKRERVGM